MAGEKRYGWTPSIVPETGSRGAILPLPGTAGLIKLIGGRRIRIEDHGTDCYGRTLATLYVPGKTAGTWLNVNERMVVLGHAWVMRRYYGHLARERQARLNRAERWARSKHMGLWRQENPVPPWKWRADASDRQLSA